MTDLIDIKTLVICYGLCCCTQLVAFILQYRINKGEQDSMVGIGQRADGFWIFHEFVQRY